MWGTAPQGAVRQPLRQALSGFPNRHLHAATNRPKAWYTRESWLPLVLRQWNSILNPRSTQSRRFMLEGSHMQICNSTRVPLHPYEPILLMLMASHMQICKLSQGLLASL